MSFQFIGSFLFAAALVAVLHPCAHRIGLVDRPNERKAHDGRIPLIGGLAIFLTFLTATGLVWPELAPSAVFYVASAVLVVGGVLDDFCELRASYKLAFQIIAVLVMALAGGVSITTVGDFAPAFTTFPGSLLVLPLTLIVAVGVLNAVNLSDGLDGLAGFQLAVAFAALAFLAERAGDGASVGALTILTAGAFGFLIFNARVFGRTKAAVFLGDAGTMFLGFAYVWFALQLFGGSRPAMSPVTALWLLLFPICDMVTMLIRRVSRGRSPFKADKEHLHHVLIMAGFTVSETVMALTAIAVAGAAIGIAGELFEVPDLIMLLGFLAAGALYLRVILRAWTVMRFLRWSICRRRAVADRRVHAERRQQHRLPPAAADRRSGWDRRKGDRRIRDLAIEASARTSAQASRSPSAPALREADAAPAAAEVLMSAGHNRAERRQG